MNTVLSKKVVSIFSLLGSLLLVLGGVLLVPLLISLVYKEELYNVYLVSISISLVLGISTRFKGREEEISLSTGMIVCVLGWIVISLVGAIPFYLALDCSYIDSLFETVSGFTTTGITVFSSLNTFPKSILFWRALTQWLGGLGFLTFFLIVTFRGQSGLFQLFTAESHKIDISRPVPNVFKTVKVFWLIYLLFTTIQMIILKILGMNFFDAITHALTTISTGGFSNYDQSIDYFRQSGYNNYIWIEYVIIIFMALGGINFLIHYKVLTGKFKELWEGTEVGYFWAIILGVTILILMNHYVECPFIWSNLEENIRRVLFQVVSILTSTGYATVDINSSFFLPLAKQLFLILMLIGGCVGSTSGGIKIIRVVILNKLFKREIRKVYYPKRAVLPVVVDGNIISDSEIFRIVALVFGWLVLIVIGGGITVVFSNLSAWSAFSGIFSAVGNMGPFYFSLEKMQSLSGVIKITYIVAMLAGRLEILPIFIILNKEAWRR